MNALVNSIIRVVVVVVLISVVNALMAGVISVAHAETLNVTAPNNELNDEVAPNTVTELLNQLLEIITNIPGLL